MLRSLYEFVGTAKGGGDLLLEFKVVSNLKIPVDKIKGYGLYRILGNDKVEIATGENKDYIDGLIAEWIDNDKQE